MCEYCDIGKENIIDLSNEHFYSGGVCVKGTQLEVEIFYETARIKINYCLMCGKNLKGHDKCN